MAKAWGQSRTHLLLPSSGAVAGGGTAGSGAGVPGAGAQAAKTPGVAPTRFPRSLSSHSFPRRDCKNLPIGPVRHIKYFNCLWRLLSRLNALE